MQKLISVLLATCIITSAFFTGCGNKDKSITSFEETKQPLSFQIKKDLFITPISAEKNATDMTDEEVISMAKDLFVNCNTAWFELYYGNQFTIVDTSEHIEYDDAIWFKVAFISSFDEYKQIFDTTFEYSAYTDYIYPALETNMREENGILYHCADRVGGGGASPPIVPLNIEITEKEAEKIVLRVTVQDLIQSETEDGIRDSIDGDATYTILKQDGYWVLKSFYGEE